MKKSIVFFSFLMPFILISTVNAETFTSHCRDSKPDIYFENGTCTGVLPDLAKDMLAELGHDIKWIQAPFARTLSDAKSGSIDLVIRHSMTAERAEFLNAFPYGYYEREVEFYLSPKFNSNVNSFEELSQLKVGALRGNFYSPNFTTMKASNLTLVTDTEQLLKMLDAGRINAAVTSRSHKIELFQGTYTKANYVDKFLNPLHISVPKNSPKAGHSDQIAALLLEYRKSGKLDSYFKKYGKAAPAQQYD